MKTKPSKKYAVRIKANGVKAAASTVKAKAFLPPVKAAAAESSIGIDLASINASVASIRAVLPEPRVLTNANRQQLFKMKDKRAAFVQNARNAAADPLVQAVLPPSLDRAEFEANAALTATLNKVLTILQQLVSDVDDTAMAVGSDTMNAAAKLYAYVKAGAEDNPGLKPIAEQLSEAFKRTGAKAAPAAGENK